MPVGNNKLGSYLAHSDKWYRRHIYDSFKSSLALCPQYPSDIECPIDAMKESHMDKALPVTNLRKLLQDYVRQAKNVFPVCVFEVLCWAAADEAPSGARDSTSSDDPSKLLSQQASPDIVIPFVMQVEIGVNAQLAYHRSLPVATTSRNQSIAKTELRQSAKELLGDKDVYVSPVELSVSYIMSSMSSSDGDRRSKGGNSGSNIDNFATLSFNNFPISRYNIVLDC